MRAPLVVVAAIVVLPLAFALGQSLASDAEPAGTLAQCRADLAIAQQQTEEAQRIARDQTTLQLRAVKAMETCAMACADKALQ